MSQPRVVFEGNKFFWRTRNNVDVWILEHKDMGIFEVVCYEPSLDMESKRFYLLGSVLLRKIDNAAIDHKLSFAMRNNVPLTDTYVDGARNEVIRDYVLARLLLETFNAQEKQFSMKWNTLAGDVEFGEEDDLLVEKPEPLQQFQAKHNKIYMSDVVSAVMDSLQELKKGIEESCEAAQAAEKSVRTTLGVKDRWRMPLVINKVIRGMVLNKRDDKIFKKVQSNLTTPEEVSRMEAMFQKPAASAAVTPRTATQGDTTPNRTPRRSIGGATTPPLNLTPRRANSSFRRGSGSGVAGNLRGETASSLARAANSEFTPPQSTKAKGPSTKHPPSPSKQSSTRRFKAKSTRSSGVSGKDGIASASSGASMSFSCDDPSAEPGIEPSMLEAMTASIKAISNSIRSSFSTKRGSFAYTIAVSPSSGSQKSSATEALLNTVPEVTQTGTDTQTQSQTSPQGAAVGDEVEDSLAQAMANANNSVKVKPSTRRSFLSSMLHALTGGVDLISWGGSAKVTPV